MPRIILDNFNLGGIADSKYLGIQKSVSAMVGLDIHSEPGVIKVNQKLTKDSDATVDALIKNVVVCSDGNTYFFQANGKIIKRTSAGVYSLFRTISGNPEILGAIEYDGFVYYATATSLGRWYISDPTIIFDAWRTFQNGNTSYHPMIELNGILYIGDGNVVAQVEQTEISGTGTISSSGTSVTGASTLFSTEGITYGTIRLLSANGNSQKRFITMVHSDTLISTSVAFSPVAGAGSLYKLAQHIFSANALDLSEGKVIKTLGALVTELLIGTSGYADFCHIYRWNTWSVSFSSDDIVPEDGVNSFISTDNYVMVQAGGKGNFYVYSNDRLEQAFKLPGDWLGKTGIVYPNAAVNLNTVPLFALSNVSGNPASQGVYSFGRRSPNYPNVLNLEYVISQAKLADISIGAICIVGGLILVSWKDGTSYGVDKLDTTLKYASAYFESRIVITERSTQSDAVIRACYKSLPTGTNMIIKVKKNNGTWGDALTTKNDTTRKFIETTTKIGTFNTLEVRIDFVVSTNATPELELVEIDI